MLNYPSDWEVKKLGECVTENLSYGINAPAIPYDRKNPKYIRITDIYDDTDIKSVAYSNCERYILHYGDIVIARTGASVGKSYCYDTKDGKLVYAGYLIKASIDCDKFDPRYISAQLKTPRYWSWVISMSMRSGQPGINSQEYSSFPILLPPLAEQQAIAETLTAFDTHITNLAALIDKKKAIRDGALDDLMSGRIRLKGFSGEWNEDEIRNLSKTLSTSLKIKTSDYLNIGHYPIIDQSKSFISGYTNEEAIFPQNEYIIFGEHTCIVKYVNFAFAQGADGIKVLIADVTRAIPKYLYYCMLNIKIDISYARHWAIMKMKKIPLPSLAEQQAIADTLTTLDDEITALEAEREKFIQIRDGAMNDLLTGKVRLKI